jgi:hypothetical protein
MKSFLISLEPVYIFLSRFVLSTRIIDDCYNNIKEKIKKILRLSKFWNISVNKSAYIIKGRIINFCILISWGPFCIKYQLVDIGTASTKKIVK